MRNDLRKALIMENDITAVPSKVSQHGNNFIVNNLPLEKLVDIKDEKEIIDGMGGENRYVASQANNYKMLGGVGGASAGVKAGLEVGDAMAAPDEATLAANMAGGAIGFLGGGYLGSKFGKDYGKSLAQKTYNKIYK